MNKIEKILKLAEKTGDKIIVTKPDGSESFVIMPFNDYEKIVEGQEDIRELSERELWAQIDRDINLWKERHDDFEDPFAENNFNNNLQEFNPCCGGERDCERDYDLDGGMFFDREFTDEVERNYEGDDGEDEEYEEEYNVDDLIPEFEEEKVEEVPEFKNEEPVWPIRQAQDNSFVNEPEDAGFEFEEIDDDFEVEDEILRQAQDNPFVDELEEKIIEDQIEKEIQKKSRFAIPQERLTHTEKPIISYEDIHDESEINVEDLMNAEKTQERVIDVSFSEEDVPENF